MMHPDTELRLVDAHVGYGVFARADIPRGTLTWVPDELDQRFTPARRDALHPLSREAVLRYGYIDSTGTSVLCWDHARFVNHSCNCNCLSSGFEFEFAIRDIEAGEQITDDYGLMNLVSLLECACGAAQCRRRIGPDDIRHLADGWDISVRDAFPSIGRVPQPLWPMLTERTEVEAVLEGRKPIPSCRGHRMHD